METASSPLEPTPNDAEAKSDANQRLVAFGATVGSIALAAQHMLIEGHLHGWPVTAVTVTSLLGWGVFGWGVFRSRRLRKTPEGRAYLEQAQADERLSAIRSRAFTFGYFVVLAVQVLLIVAWTLFSHTDTGLLSIPVAASSTIAAGVTGVVLRYQSLQNR